MVKPAHGLFERRGQLPMGHVTCAKVRGVLAVDDAYLFHRCVHSTKSHSGLDGGQDIVRACEENMGEDENMARWLDLQLPSVV